jgi:hypothetical protein
LPEKSKNYRPKSFFLIQYFFGFVEPNWIENTILVALKIPNMQELIAA